MASIKIAVVNVSTVITSASEVATAVAALQKQVSNDFAPVWGIDADLRVISHVSELRTGEWVLAILDDSDQAGALGYHDVTPDGLPLGKVFARTDQRFGEQWTGTASHELLEMLADPTINLTVFNENENGRGGRLYAYEVCDACEAEEFGYRIDGVLVSDFIYPAWFESFRQHGSTQFDFKNFVRGPFELLRGGYIGIYDIGSGSGWTQLTANRQPNFRARPPVGSRRERRDIPMNQRLKSTFGASTKVHAGGAAVTPLSATPTFEEVDEHIQRASLVGLPQCGARVDAAASPAAIVPNICAAYKVIRPVLSFVLSFPFIPQSWKTALKAFMDVLDGLCP